MLLLAVLAKLGKLVPPTMERGARWVYRFFANAGTYPLIFCVGVVLTPWKPMVAAFSPAICATVLASVVTLAATGFLLARRAAMHPIETAIICVCHAGAGGTGDVAILTAGKRLNLMATAQVATKIGGFATVTVALLTFPRFY
jgi:Na+/citrate or Na+/malate symporter